MTFKNYLYSLRFFILFAFLFFIFAAVLGYFSAKQDPQSAGLVLEKMKEVYGSVIGMSPFSQFVFVFFNNGFTLFLILALGFIFGIFPLLVLFSNGAILGILAFLSKGTLSWSKFFMGTLPHGIIEIPVMILACAVGLKIGRMVFQKVFKKQETVKIKPEIALALEFFLKFLLPLLALAATIEIFITAKLLGV